MRAPGRMLRITPLLMAGSDERHRMLIERFAPGPDGTRTEHALIPGRPNAVYPCVMSADFLRAVSENRLVRALFALRSLAERAVAALTQRPFSEPSDVDSLRLCDLTGEGEWVLLGEDPPHEVAFGVIGRFWAGETVWEMTSADEFAAFATPGFAKIVCNFSLRTYGRDHTLVSYEARTEAIGADARRAFLRYWRLSSGWSCARSCA